MTPTRTTGVLLAAVLVLGTAGSASAQTQFGGMNVEGSVEAGGRWYLTDEPKNKDRAKFEEYRDMSAGPMLQGLQLKFFTPDLGYASEIDGKNWGRRDQEFSLSTGRTGLWKLEFNFDELLHTFSTNARTLEHETSRGIWHAPTIRSLTDFNGQATSRELRDISVNWYTGRLRFTLTPTPDTDLSAQYQMIRKEGDRPFSMIMGTGSGNNFIELLEPIEQTIHEVRLGFTLARERWQFQAGYVFSAFVNDLQSVTFENPCWQVPIGPCAATDVNANRRQFGRSALPPSNQAHTFSLSGGVNLPLRTRINGNVTYSIALQNADFLPIATTACPTCDALPQQSLNGNVQTVNVSLGATSRPLPLPLTLSAKYRLYGHYDESDQFIISHWALNDRTADGVQGVWQNTRESFTRQNADVDARYQIIQPLAAAVGVGWEQWLRGPERDTRETDELFVKAAVDATPFDWLLARLTYKPSFKRISNYSRWGLSTTGAVPSNTATLNDIVGLSRRFDEAERDRQRVDLLLQFTPFETVSVTPMAGWRYDDFVSSPFGMQWETSWSAGLDVSWTPVERLAFSAGYMRELIDRDYNTRTSSTQVNGDYMTNLTDVFDTFHLSGKLGLIPKVLDWTFGTNYATSYGNILTRLTDANRPGFTPLAIPARLAKRMPDFDDQLVRVDTALRYHFSKSWTASVFYAFEQWRHHDWRTDNWLPYNPMMAGGPYGMIYLGSDPRNYDNHMMGITLAYTFK
jgi:MtrB/PioB family decaheme-associated outer membrane protein